MTARIMIAAPKSGSGKTMITCGIIAHFKRQDKKVVSFKCGPDYIDPMFHRRVLGIPSGNLDTFFTGEEMTRALFRQRSMDAELAVLEGVMGYYDGLGGQSVEASSYEVAQVTRTPVLLVVDAKGASVSLAAVIKGLLEYRDDSRIAGIILNRVSSGYYERIRSVIEESCQIPVVGYVEELKDLQVPSRHLGLVAPDEMDAFERWINRITDAMEQTIDFAAIERIAGQVEELPDTVCEEEKKLRDLHLKQSVRIGIARDAAFSFYYAENLELLERMGAEPVWFSPLEDAALPERLDGLLLGGGYPENYAARLSGNHSMRQSIAQSIADGMPVLAECGGFLYLQKELEGADGTVYPMVGVFSGRGYRKDRLSRFGYMQAKAQRAGVYGPKDILLKGHEFHYWDCTDNGDGFEACKPVGGRPYTAIQYTDTIAAGFPHLYYYSNPEAVYSFLETCRMYQAKRIAKQRWDSIAKPIDSLGRLEEAVVKISEIRKCAKARGLARKGLLIFCADHGVVAEGVTQTGQEVTRIVSENFAAGKSTVNVMAGCAGVDVYTVDVGMKGARYPQGELVTGAVLDRKVREGTADLAVESAMTRKECEQAIRVGMELTKELKDRRYDILATGEMGIGNTTATSVLAAVFLDRAPEAVTGKGAGLSQEGIRRKCSVVSKALERVHALGLREPVDILAEVGGLEIAAMTGVFLGGMRYEIPVVMDGVISSVAALTAVKIDERCRQYMLASHCSGEPVAQEILRAIGVEPVVYGNMCLGEGTGAMTVFPILDMAFAVYEKMGSFTDYAIKPYERFEASDEDV